jgi:GR25 family glycosyltransferase involved in LPS biosynthesis
MQAHIITLKGHALSERLSQECQAQAALFGINVQIRDAVNGHHHLEHFKRNNLRPRSNDRRKLVPGHFGNFLSHYYLWRECAAGAEPYLILEHDGYFVRPLPQDVLDRFTHVLKLDAENPGKKDYHTIMQQQQDRQGSTEILPMDKRADMNKDAGFYSPGAYAYIIKPTACRLLINWVSDNGFLSTDNQLASGVVDIRVCRPTVARLHPLFAQGDNLHTLSTAKLPNQLLPPKD